MNDTQIALLCNSVHNFEVGQMYCKNIVILELYNCRPSCFFVSLQAERVTAAERGHFKTPPVGGAEGTNIPSLEVTIHREECGLIRKFRV